MIELQIIETPDFISLGNYKYKFHHIAIGRGVKNTIIVDDKSLTKEHGSFRVTNKGLLYESEHSFLHNDKKAVGSIILKKDDILQIANTQIKVVNYSDEGLLDPNLYYEKLEELSSRPALLNLVYAIEEELISETEKEMNALEK